MNRIKNILTQNVGLKVGAIVLAVVIWLAIVNVDDPNITKTFTTVVTFENAEVLTDAGRYYELIDGNNTVTFRVTAKRSIIERLSSDDFTAVANLEKLENDERVPVEISAIHYTSSVTIPAKKYYLNIKVGDELSHKFDVEGVTNGTPASGCVVGGIKVEPSTISIDGPEYIVDSISRVTATVDVSGANGNMSKVVTPKLLDKEGNEVDTSRLTLSNSSVSVSVSIANVKSVAVQMDTTNAIPDGLLVSSITINPSSVQVKGSAEALNEISAINIPSSVIDFASINSDFETVVDITAYLPEGVSLVNSKDANVTISIKLTNATVTPTDETTTPTDEPETPVETPTETGEEEQENTEETNN